MTVQARPYDADDRPRRGVNHGLAAATSLAAHAAVILALASLRPDVLQVFDPEPMNVALVDLPKPPEPLAPPAQNNEPAPSPNPPAPAKPTPPRNIARKAVIPPDVKPILADEGPTTEPAPILSDAEIASAATAGSGGGNGSGAGGGTCDMISHLEDRLRKDPDVRAAVSRAHQAAGPAHKALLVWNGDWITSTGQEGKGIAGVREAMMMEIAFAPAACRAKPMRGLVLLSLNESGSAKVAFGSSAWKWSDLLIPRGGVAGHTYQR